MVDFSIVLPCHGSHTDLAASARAVAAYFDSALPGRSREILIIPNPAGDPSVEAARRAEGPGVRVLVHEAPAGKGAALRTGVLAAQGSVIFLIDADLPYDLSFCAQALPHLEAGAVLVHGNRRDPRSWFDLPTSVLRLAYRRHRLGLAFNAIVRLVFGIKTRDTQAGIKAMPREFAREAFAGLRCPGFYYDLELFIRARGRQTVALPVRLILDSEKSTVRVLRESWQALYWLTRLAITQRSIARGGGPR